MVTVSVDRDISLSVYEQIATQLRQAVAEGALTPGTTLPSVRQLAGDLGVNLNTVARAYRILESEGFLVIKGRSGASVASPAAEIEPEIQASLLDQMRATIARMRQAGMTTQDLLTLLQREINATSNLITEQHDE